MMQENGERTEFLEFIICIPCSMSAYKSTGVEFHITMQI